MKRRDCAYEERARNVGNKMLSETPAATPPSRFWRRYLNVDLRSLAAARIALGVVILVDLVARAFTIRRDYTDAGVLPRSVVFALGQDFWSLLFISGTLRFAVAHFLLHAVAATCLMIGFHSRIAAAFCLVFSMSLDGRLHAITAAGDMLLNIFLVLLVCSHSGDLWSIDARRAPAVMPSPIDRPPDIAGFAMIFQLALLYLGGFAAKQTPEWLGQYTLVDYVVRTPNIGRPWAVDFLKATGVGPLFTQGTLFIEIAIPTLLLFPFEIPACRMLAFILGVSLHLGFILSLRIGTFPYMCIAGWLVVLPPHFWRALARIGVFSRSILAASDDATSPETRTRSRDFITTLRTVGASAMLFWMFAAMTVRITRRDFGLWPVSRAGWELFRFSQEWTMFVKNDAAPRMMRWPMLKPMDGPLRDMDLISGQRADFSRLPRDIGYLTDRPRKMHEMLGHESREFYTSYVRYYAKRTKIDGKKPNCSRAELYMLEQPVTLSDAPAQTTPTVRLVMRWAEEGHHEFFN